jgi:hypothetical protein
MLTPVEIEEQCRLISQIAGQVVATKQAEETYDMDWAVLEMIRQLPTIEGAPGYAVYTAALYRYCYSVVKRKADKLDPDQLPIDILRDLNEPRLPGLEHVRSRYTFPRDGRRANVPVWRSIPDELRARAQEFRKAGGSQIAHGDELEILADLIEAADRRSGYPGPEPSGGDDLHFSE